LADIAVAGACPVSEAAGPPQPTVVVARRVEARSVKT
jgi:hypothetical protein